MTWLPFAVFVFAWGSLFAAVLGRRAPRQTPFEHAGHAFLVTSVVFAILIFLLTEGLSLFHWLSRPAIGLAWAVVALGAAGFRAARHRKSAEAGHSAQPQIDTMPRADNAGRATLAAIGLLVVGLFILGVVAAPNNWDTMTYHLPRVMHWLQDASVGHYATSGERQNMFPPLAEYALTHIVALSGNDRLTHLVQWYGFIGCIIAAALVAGQIGGRRSARIVAAVFAATLPTAILQSTSAKNDVLAAFVLLTAFFFAYRLWDAGDFGRPAVAAFAATVGLGLLTKATLYLYLLPLCFVVAFFAVRRAGIRQAAVRVAIPLVLLVGALNTPHWARNLATYRSPIGLAGSTNTTWHPLALASVAVRNAGLHVFRTPLPGSWRAVRLLDRLHEWCGLDLNDPRTTWAATAFGIPRWPSRHEDDAGNPLHLLLGALALLLLARGGHLRGRVLVHALCVLAAALLFCAVLKWQPWHARLHIPLFLASAPLVGIAAQSFVRRRARVIAIGILLLSAAPYLLLNQARPLLGPQSVFVEPRERQYFTNRREAYPSYAAAAARLRDLRPRVIGLALGGDSYEYPLWALLKSGPASGVRIEHIPLESAPLADSHIPPDVVFCTQPAKAARLESLGWRCLERFGDDSPAWLYGPPLPVARLWSPS